MTRIALALSYIGQRYQGWQSQGTGLTVQERLEAALETFCEQPVRTICAGRTDAGVHALMQVVHFETEVQRAPYSWIRGTNRYLPDDIAVQWAAPMPREFHARACALARRYVYLVLESPVRPSIEAGRVGWSFRPLCGDAMRAAAERLLGQHDFSSFRAAECQAKSPVKTLRRIDISSRGEEAAGRYWRFEFEADAFLHHMIRNIMGCLILIGQRARPPDWIDDVLAARNRSAAAPTFSAAGLYFLGPIYEDRFGVPRQTAAYHWLP